MFLYLNNIPNTLFDLDQIMDSMEEFQRQNIAARLQNIRERREHESFFVELVKRKVWWQVHGNIVDNADYMQPKKHLRTLGRHYPRYISEGIVFEGLESQRRSIFSLHNVEAGSGEWDTIANLLTFSSAHVGPRLCAIQRVQNPELHATWLKYIADHPPLTDPTLEFRIGYHGASNLSSWPSILSQGVQPALCSYSGSGVGTFFAGDAAESLHPGYSHLYQCESDPEATYSFIGLFACYAGNTYTSLAAGGPIPPGYGSVGREASGPDSIPTAFCVQAYARVYPAYILTFYSNKKR